MLRPQVITCIFLITLLTGACATTPAFNTKNVVTNVTPRQSVAQFAMNKGKKMLWGGIILNSTNTKQGTQFEVLAYPLDNDMRPQPTAPTVGRFLGDVPLYLETADYAPGRMLTVTGELTATQEGKIGEAEYRYPVLQIDQHFLWSQEDERPVDTSIHFGIGVIFH